MSNTWDYTLIFREQYPLSEKVFAIIIETANSFGYSMWNPTPPKRIRGINLNGEDELVFEDFEAARTFLCSTGGLIGLWKNYENDWYDIGIIFQPKEVSLGVTHDLREDREEDVQQASDLKNLFIALCQQLEPVYSYSTDEYRLEAALAALEGKDFQKEWDNFNQVIRNFGQPSLLFWINYFDLVYWRQIDLKSFESVSHRKEFVSDKGVFIYLAEHPWEARIAILAQEKYHLV